MTPCDPCRYRRHQHPGRPGRGAVVRRQSIRRYPNADYKARGQDIAQILAEYLHDAGDRRWRLRRRRRAGAGRRRHDDQPGLDDRCRQAAAATGATRVAILNDLQAQGHALGHIAADHLRSGDRRPGQGRRADAGGGPGHRGQCRPRPRQGAARVVPPRNAAMSTCRSAVRRGLAPDALHRAAAGRRAARLRIAGSKRFWSGRGLANLARLRRGRGRACRPHAASAEVLAGAGAGEAQSPSMPPGSMSASWRRRWPTWR
jgi:glucokinase